MRLGCIYMHIISYWWLNFSKNNFSHLLLTLNRKINSHSMCFVVGISNEVENKEIEGEALDDSEREMESDNGDGK